MMPEKPNPKIAVTVKRPTSSCVSAMAAMVQNCHAEPISTVSNPPMRSEIHPHIWRDRNAIASSIESIAAPWVGLMPRSLQSATRWVCGIAIGTQQQSDATDIIANTRFGGQPSTLGRAAPGAAAGGGATSGGFFSTRSAIGTTMATSKMPNVRVVRLHRWVATLYSKMGAQIAPEMYWPLAINASAEPRRLSNQRL